MIVPSPSKFNLYQIDYTRRLSKRQFYKTSQLYKNILTLINYQLTLIYN